MDRYTVECRKAHCDREPGSERTYALHNFSQESCAVFKAFAIAAFPRVGAEKLMPQVTVAMLYIHEVEAQIPGYERRAMKVFDDKLNVRVVNHGIVIPQP